MTDQEKDTDAGDKLIAGLILVNGSDLAWDMYRLSAMRHIANQRAGRHADVTLILTPPSQSTIRAAQRAIAEAIFAERAACIKAAEAIRDDEERTNLARIERVVAALKARGPAVVSPSWTMPDAEDPTEGNDDAINT